MPREFKIYETVLNFLCLGAVNIYLPYCLDNMQNQQSGNGVDELYRYSHEKNVLHFDHAQFGTDKGRDQPKSDEII